VTRVWLDVDYPPQVQYLVPFKPAFEAAGADVVVTARDYLITVDLLRERDVEFHVFGGAFGRQKYRKAIGLLQRAVDLIRFFERVGRPDILLSSSRSSAIVAWRYGIPAYVVCDYEWVDLRLYRYAGVFIVHPESIPQTAFVKQGFAPSRLIPISGMKEDISLHGIDVDAVAPYDLGIESDVLRVLVRPPAEDSHYFEPAGRALTERLLARLAPRRDVLVVLSPRYGWQSRYVEGLEGAREPLVLSQPAPFVPLLKAVDAVVAAGGTMLREAAYLGRPAYSILPNRVGGVDVYLESLGRLTFVRSLDEVDRLDFGRPALEPMLRNDAMIDDLVQTILDRKREGLVP
jgi:uncharacterized protein